MNNIVSIVDFAKLSNWNVHFCNSPEGVGCIFSSGNWKISTIFYANKGAEIALWNKECEFLHCMQGVPEEVDITEGIIARLFPTKQETYGLFQNLTDEELKMVLYLIH